MVAYCISLMRWRSWIRTGRNSIDSHRKLERMSEWLACFLGYFTTAVVMLIQAKLTIQKRVAVDISQLSATPDRSSGPDDTLVFSCGNLHVLGWKDLSSSTHPSSSHASPLYSHPSRFLVVQWAQLLILKTIWEKSRLTAGGFQILETREKRESPSSFVLRIKLMHTRRDWSKEFTLKCAFSVNVDGYYINTGFESSNRISILDH